MARFEYLTVNRLRANVLLGPASIPDVITAGKKYYVDSVNGSNGNDGESPGSAFTTIVKALSLCVANRGDYIFCLPGHIETVATAGGLTFNKAGVTVAFLGNGAKKASITFTAADATLLVTSANTTLIGPRFLTGIDAVVAAINSQAADFRMYDVEYYDAAAKATTIQVLTTAAATRMVIDGYKFFASTTGTQKTDGIKTVGALDGCILKNIDISGDFSVGNLDISAAITNVKMEGIRLNNTNATPKPAAVFHASTTGFAKDFHARVASGTTYVSNVAKIQWAEDCLGYNTDGYGGEPIGSAPASGVEGKVDIIKSDLIVTQSDVKTVLSNLVVAKSDIVTTLSNLTVAKSDIVTVQSNLTVAKSDIVSALSNLAAVKSDLVVIQASEDSDMVVLKSDIVAVQSNLAVLDAASDSDMVILKSDIAAVKSDLVVIQASEDSDMVVLKSDVVAVQSNLTVLDAASDSDMVIVKSDIAAVKSDLVVIQASEDSDMVLLRSDLAALKQDLDAFIAKYTSDVP